MSVRASRQSCGQGRGRADIDAHEDEQEHQPKPRTEGAKLALALRVEHVVRRFAIVLIACLGLLLAVVPVAQRQQESTMLP